MIKSIFKKMILGVTIAGMLVTTGCGIGVGDRKGGSDNSTILTDKGYEMISLMDDKIHSEVYAEYMGFGSLLESDSCKQLTGSDYSGEADKIFKLSFDNLNMDTVLSTFEVYGELDSDKLSDAIKDDIYGRLVTSYGFVLVTRMGANSEIIALLSGYNTQKTYAYSGKEKTNCAYIYTYKDSCPVYVGFTFGEGDFVNVNGVFLLVDQCSFENENEIAKEFSKVYGIAPTVTQIK